MGLPEYGLDLDKSNPDFVALAEAYGAKGHRITGPGQLGGVLQHCLSTPGCVHVVEVPIDYASSSHLQVSETAGAAKLAITYREACNVCRMLLRLMAGTTSGLVV